MNRLTASRDSRLELGDMIRAALHLARGSGDEEAERRARELLARLAAGHPVISGSLLAWRERWHQQARGCAAEGRLDGNENQSS